MDNILLYHYVTSKKYETVLEKGLLLPSAPFNPKVSGTQWNEYIKQFSFPVVQLYTCCFFEPEPQSWKEHGLFELLMEEFAGGDHLLELTILEQNLSDPILVRDHSFHSPKNYDRSPQDWRKREVRDSRPVLREAWYQSTTQLRNYGGNFICPEVLIPFSIEISNIKVIR
ncbi:MAG TPA: hypothetical protein VJA18_03485 [Candidatus Nanoarchaeia archaeon]|nr:hypothetical protein [Candidatus Nanoarchaeia archaeon]